MSTKLPDPLLVWPPERFYWAVLDGSVLPKQWGIPRNALHYLLEPLLPEPLEAVHAVFAPLPKRKYVACTVSKEALKCVPDHVRVLSPSGPPPGLEVPIDARAINLLTGPYQSRVVKRAIRRCYWQAAAFLLVTLGLLTFGQIRRVHAAGEAGARYEAASAESIANVLSSSSSSTALPPALQLEAELRSLRLTRSAPEGTVQKGNVAEWLTEFLRNWPVETALHTESLILTEESLHLRCRLPSSEDAERFLKAIPAIEGFERELPSVQMFEREVLLTLNWRRNAEKGS